MFLKSTLATQIAHSRGWALQYGADIEREQETLEKLKKVREYYEKLDASLPEDEKWKIMKQDTLLNRMTEGLLPPETKDPIKFIDEKIKDTKKRINFASESSSGQELQARDTAETMRHLITPDKYVRQHGIRGYAESGIKAMELTKDPKKPLYLAMENIFPERFGGHPQELKYLVKLARERMVDMLTEKKLEWMESDKNYFKTDQHKLYEDNPTFKPGLNPFYQPGISKDKAMKLAQDHIKATFDTGHANMWRKYYQQDPRKSRDQNEANYKKWYLEQVESLAKDGIIGNVHLSDNFGYQDDHLAPGQGNAPIKDFVKILKKHGYKGAWTVEPGADASTDQGDFWGLMKTWRHFGAPIYGEGGPTRMGAPAGNFSDVQNSYFGKSYSPYFIFGSYAPSNDWQLWSQIPFE